MSRLINQIRFYHYIAGVLTVQQADPLCGICKAYANTISAMREGFTELEKNHADTFGLLPADVVLLFEEARRSIMALRMPEGAEGQKKAGKCQMPEGVCFIKSSKAMLSKI